MRRIFRNKKDTKQNLNLKIELRNRILSASWYEKREKTCKKKKRGETKTKGNEEEGGGRETKRNRKGYPVTFRLLAKKKKS